MRASDIEKLQSVSRPDIAPDGSRVVVSVTHPTLLADATVGQLWEVALDGRSPRRITRGFRDADPTFSPDGESIAFLRAAPGAPSQLVVMPAAGGEVMTLTDAKLGVAEFSWSPDSSKIAYIARVPEQGRYGTVDGIGAGAEPARRMTGVTYKANGLGYTNDRRAHAFVVAVPPLGEEPVYQPAPLPDGSTAEAAIVPASTQVTRGDNDNAHPRFIGDDVAVISARHAGRDSDLLNQLWLGDAALTPLGRLAYDSFEVAGDGTIFALAQDLGDSGIDFVAKNAGLYRLDTGGATRLTDPELDLQGLTVTGNRVLVRQQTRGTTQLLELGDTVIPLTSGEIEIQGQAVHGDTVVVTYASPDTFGDVGVLAAGAVRPLTSFSAELVAAGILNPTELTVTGRNGYPVHGWVVTPAGEGPHPTLLMIHGGPYAASSVHVLDEAQVCADAGYAVVYCNPRGSAGYGTEHGIAIKGAMGTVDLDDVLDFLDGALDATPGLDRNRLGILGGSYGGYLTAWTIAHDHRFRAAIVERGFLDPEAFVGSSDIGGFFSREYNGTDHDLVRAQSPQAVAHRVATPTLVIHSEDDLRCPLGQAETWFATIHQHGVESELLIFPGENHELSRSGRPRHRVQRFEAILDWFGRYL